MDKEEVLFLIKMMLDEIMELGATVSDPEDVKATMTYMICNSKNIPKLTTESTDELIGEQADALIDCYYYSLNAMAKKGVNLSKIFQVVHKANMAKRDPATGKFIKREDGKIIKPEGWQAPDITAEIKRQIEEGSFEAGDDFVKSVSKGQQWICGVGCGYYENRHTLPRPTGLTSKHWEVCVFLSFGFTLQEPIFMRIFSLFDPVTGVLNWDKTRIDGRTAREYVLAFVQFDQNRVNLVRTALATDV